MSNVRTVSDAKRDFYKHHARPINSIYRRVADELLVEMHLLSVNSDFQFDPIYALGVVTSFDRFMQGYEPAKDRDSIFNAICRAIGSTPEEYREAANWAKSAVADMSLDTFKQQFEDLEAAAGQEGFRGMLSAIASRDRFKYNRPFGIGLYTLVEMLDPEALSDKEQREKLFTDLCSQLNFSADKLVKDLDLYRSNLEKFAQAQEVMKDMLAADRKKREDRAKAAAEKATVPADGGADESEPEPENSEPS
ncbi:photosystem II biogenesis protein Psp29 [filamentous cyanobacterium CCP5]|nr:photosystem II biogenesis protein Psp29 [filamentous cyanobacterium CCP5]